MIKRIIPSSGEELPCIGLGTWKGFDVSDHQNLQNCKEVLEVMKKSGSTLIDTSPMYARSEKVIGDLSQSSKDFFYATKVWIEGKDDGIRQMNDSFIKMKCDKMDLMQIHNLVDWKTHLETLKKWREEGKIKYIGITHYTDSMHEELESVLRTERFDFVQFNYSILSVHAEKRLLKACADLGVATLINRPLGEGKLYNSVRNKILPDWAKENDINNWTEYFLKYILSDPAITCIIPGTANPDHMLENINAGKGKLPDAQLRKKMLETINSL